MSETKPLVEIVNLSVSFPGPPGGRRVEAADNVNLSIFPGQTLAVVGESGSGKSVSCLSILQLHPTPPASYDNGEIRWTNGENAPTENLMAKSEREMRAIRGNQIAMIFQEPMTSLNPVYTIGNQIIEAILLHQSVSKQQAIDIAANALRDVGIADPAARLKEYPHQLSGGMRQRVMIAMALACQPSLLLADEPTTALDVTIQAQILELLKRLQHDHKMAILLITHDLGVVAESADVVAVMYAGRVVEYANVNTLFNRPLHPYTRGLLRSMPVLGANASRLDTVMDGATIPEDFPAGYKVHPHEITPDPAKGYGGPNVRLHEVETEHWVLCEPLDGVEGNPTFPRVAWVREPAHPNAAS
ncbi:ABC transporter ATP-binding protein [Mucisphaera sp.]|uniref:ABC transporter ATP-binding protein n=1 Tax=Mucisphaera sp. TaxID=2913024 RepID=UPI003D1115C2